MAERNDRSPDQTRTQGEPRKAPGGARDAQITDLPVADPQRYALGGEHARGGLGRILSARDRILGRPVAIKELLSEGPESAARFVREALVTARLQHPAIVPIYDAGRWPSGEPYYAMKMIAGRSLKEVIAGAAGLDERLALLPVVIAVADAVAYAHSHRIIHRDLKPGNVLIGDFGETVVIDWGLAKKLGGEDDEPGAPPAAASGELTVSGSVMGTPQYMAPEQARGEPLDERADVYALGAILYHMLAGAPPYPGATWQEALAQTLAGPPRPVEARQPATSPELAAIVGKAMARDAAERYSSARDLAEDLKRFQTGKIVSSHHYSAWALLRRWLARHRLPVALAAAFALVLAVTLVVSFARIARARDQAQARRDELILMQARSALERSPTLAIAWLKTYSIDAHDWKEACAIAEDARSRGVVRAAFPKALDHWLSPDGARWLVLGMDGILRTHDVASGKSSTRSLDAGDGEIFVATISQDGRRVVTEGAGLAHVWDLTSGKTWSVGRPADKPLAHDMRWMSLSPDGARLATLHAARELFISDLGSELGSDAVRSWDLGPGMHLQGAFSPDGRSLALPTWRGMLQLAHVDGGELEPLVDHVTGYPTFSPDGKLLAVGVEGGIWLRDMTNGRTWTVPHEGGSVSRIAFPSDGRRFATVGRLIDTAVRLWDVAGGESSNFGVQPTRGVDLLFSADGQHLVASDSAGGLRVWDLTSGERQIVHAQSSGPAAMLAATPDAARIASMSVDDSVELRDLRWGQHRALGGSASAVTTLAFSPDGRWLVSRGEGELRVCDANGASCLTRKVAGEDRGFSFSADGRRLLATDEGLWLWTPPDGERPLVIPSAREAALSPDGRLLAWASTTDHALRVRDLDRDEEQIVFPSDEPLSVKAFSPDSRLLAFVKGTTAPMLWDASTGTVRSLATSGRGVPSMSFSPDGRTIVGLDGSQPAWLKTWEVTGGSYDYLVGHDQPVTRWVFSPDSRALASASLDSTVRVWDLASRRPRILTGHQGPVHDVALSADGKTLASAGEDGSIRLWDLAAGTARVLPGHEGAVRSVAFSPDGKRLASGGDDRTVRIWFLDRLPPPIPSEPARARAFLDELTTAVLQADDTAYTP